MKIYLFSLSLLLSCSVQSMWRVTATLPQPNGQSQVVEFDIDSGTAAREIMRILQLPYSEPTADNILVAQNAHRDVCRELNKEYMPLSDQEAKKLYERIVGEQMLDAIKTHQPQLYPLVVGILAGKTAADQSQFKAGA